MTLFLFFFVFETPDHRRTGRCGVLAIATWAAWFWAAQGRLLTKKKEERKGQKDRFNILATAGLRTQSAPAPDAIKRNVIVMSNQGLLVLFWYQWNEAHTYPLPVVPKSYESDAL